MNCHRPRAWCAILACLTIGVGTVHAQPPGPGSYTRPPAFSPYLNLNRGGSPAINYYGLVRPEVQFRQSLLHLSNDVAANQQALGSGNPGFNDMPFTGHPTQFMNLSGYFMNNGTAGAGNYGYGVRSAQNNRNRFSASFAPGSMGGASTGIGAPPRR
jgi:hypothetical protein